ncbi:MAG: methyltransferase domain-containing protein [Anaerolineales bacterium]|nr:methyltransferase domain-containing protein [Anaerolineales bacterium]
MTNSQKMSNLPEMSDSPEATNSEERYARFAESYANGKIPWAAELPPPEVIAYVAEAAPGRGLDLGCGYGRTSIYLAQNGWHVDGVDFIPQAIAEAKKRSAAAGVEEQTNFYVSPVTQLNFLSGPYDLAVDIGCMHNFADAELDAYRDELTRLLVPGGIYLLFAHLHIETAESTRWIKEQDLLNAFAQDFDLLHVEYGSTQVADNPPWPSAWYRYQRRN